MNNAPERIWANVELSDENDKPLMGEWNSCDVGADDDTVYIRLDLHEAEVARLRADLRHVIDERDRTFALMLARAEKTEAERDALWAHPYLPAEEIAAIERGNRRWHGEYDTTVSVRWEPYKPDGQRQMKAKGRWQTMTYNGCGYFRWENCNRPAHVRQALKGNEE